MNQGTVLISKSCYVPLVLGGTIMKTRAEIEKEISENQAATEAATEACNFKEVTSLIMERGKLLQQLSEIQIQEMEKTNQKYKEELKGNMFYNMFF